MGCAKSQAASGAEDGNAVDFKKRHLSMLGHAGEKAVPPVSEKEKTVAKAVDEGNILDLFPDSQTSQKRMFALGTPSELQQKAFADKKIQKSSNAEDSGKDFKIGFVCKKGLKPESPNQDDFSIFVTDAISIFGIFDGHGPYGHDISNFVHETLPEAVVKDERFKEDPVQALTDSFPRTHDLCIEAAQKTNFDCALSGTTATLTLFKQGILYVANVGDSRAVLAVDRGGTLKAVDLTHDHKPDCEVESRRITASGKGCVRRLEGDIPKRVFLKDKMYPGLAMTRSIGDTVGVEAGVICTPDVTKRIIEQDWKFLLLCSDGVWEFISSQEAVDIVSRFQPSDCQKATEALACEAWNRWIKEEGNVVDDITVIINWFEK